MLGADWPTPPADWRAKLADWLVLMLLRRVEDALALRLSRGARGGRGTAGRRRTALPSSAARRRAAVSADFAELLDCDPAARAWTCAPAVAVAVLLAID